MIQKIKLKLMALSVLGILAAPIGFAGVASATATIQENVCQGTSTLQVSSTNSTTSCAFSDVNDDNVNRLITKIINIMSTIVGVIAVIMIIIGGFRYITSGGDTTKVSGAKNTILYGLIGLVIVALAQIIVKFVLKNVTATS